MFEPGGRSLFKTCSCDSCVAGDVLLNSVIVIVTVTVVVTVAASVHVTVIVI